MIEDSIFSDYIKNHKLNIPEICPSCGESLEIHDNGTITCRNPLCPAKISHKFRNFFELLKIDGAGESICNNLAKIGVDIEDLLKGDKDYFCSAANGINGNKIYNNLHKKLETPITLGLFLSLFDLDGFSEKKLKYLEKTPFFKDFYHTPEITLELFKYVKETDFVKIDIETIKSDSVKIDLYNEINNKIVDMINSIKYFKFEIPKNKTGYLKGYSFCFTGKACKPRAELEKMVTDNGGTISSVKKGLSYLVTDDTGSGSSKNIKAEKLGIKIMTSLEFINFKG